MSKKSVTEVSVTEFDRAIREYRRNDVLELLRQNVWDQVEEDRKSDCIRQLIALRNDEILRWIGKNISPFRTDYFALDLTNAQNRNFTHDALEKYEKKFNLAEDSEAEELFDLACRADAVGVLKNLIRQKKARNCYKEIGAYSPEIFTLLPEVQKELTDNEYVDACFTALTSEGSEAKLFFLADHAYELDTKNDAGKDVRRLLNDRLRENAYPHSKAGSIMRTRDRMSLQGLEKILAADQDTAGTKSKKRLIPFVICAVLAVIIVCIIVIPRAGQTASDTDSTSYDTTATDGDTAADTDTATDGDAAAVTTEEDSTAADSTDSESTESDTTSDEESSSASTDTESTGSESADTDSES